MAAPQIEPMCPFFVASDVDRIVAFYQKKLGFETRYKEPEGGKMSRGPGHVAARDPRRSRTASRGVSDGLAAPTAHSQSGGGTQSRGTPAPTGRQDQDGAVVSNRSW
jgi:hypothetical protein